MKKLFALILTVAMLATMSVTAFAANTTGGSTEVSFNVDPTYTVTIPAKVELQKIDTDGAITYENDYTITADAGVRLLKGDTIVITVVSDYVMETPQGATLDYTITKGGADLEDSVVAVFKTDKTEQTSTIHIAAGDPEFAGDFEDTVTFNISVVKPAPTIISFTLNGESYQAEEGMTLCQWAESAYDVNDKYFDTGDGTVEVHDSWGFVYDTVIVDGEEYGMLG